MSAKARDTKLYLFMESGYICPCDFIFDLCIPSFGVLGKYSPKGFSLKRLVFVFIIAHV